ncbi:hypothetical protein TcWFU_006228 [Taenia crassiceps]|uniref:Uncharacterized protein n=1 Tax=Taenia crassiceps TaxID=6207 RepID=A0ABR4Q9P7_9CEST
MKNNSLIFFSRWKTEKDVILSASVPKMQLRNGQPRRYAEVGGQPSASPLCLRHFKSVQHYDLAIQLCFHLRRGATDQPHLDQADATMKTCYRSTAEAAGNGDLSHSALPSPSTLKAEFGTQASIACR